MVSMKGAVLMVEPFDGVEPSKRKGEALQSNLGQIITIIMFLACRACIWLGDVLSSCTIRRHIYIPSCALHRSDIPSGKSIRGSQQYSGHDGTIKSPRLCKSGP